MTFYSFSGYVTVPVRLRLPLAPFREGAGEPVDLYVLVERGQHLVARPQGEGIHSRGEVPATLVAAHRPLERARLPVKLQVDCWQPWPEPVAGCLVRDVVQGAQVGDLEVEEDDLMLTVALLVRRTVLPAAVLSASAAGGGEENGGG